MKKPILILILLASVYSLKAQITVNRSHVIVAGQIVVQSNDTNVRAVQTAGTNKTWDFSSLVSSERDTLKFNPSQWYPGYTYFPNANIGQTSSESDSSFTFIKIDNNAIKVEGTYDMFMDTFSVNKFNKTILTFPSTYNTTFTESIFFPSTTFPLGFDPDSTGPAPFIDSVRISPEMKVSSKIDGWGSITTPLGTFNCLMQNEMDIQTAKLEMNVGGFWINIPSNVADGLGFGSFTDTSYNHSFWTDDASVGFPIVTYSFSQGETTTNSTDWLQTKPQVNGINGNNIQRMASVYPNPATSSFKVTLPGNTTARLFMYDLNGKMVKDVMVENGSSIDISDITNGIYTVKYVNETDGTVLQTNKLIKY